jgi:4-amino-4-deoxy-L-arabinose transferase-like glycosyltransferase
MGNGRIRNAAALLLILAAGALLRIQHLRADPPLLIPSLSGSAGIYFDEGIYSQNARNRILYHRWITDEWNPLIYNSLLTGFYYLGFRLFGISIVTVKAISILLGMLAVLCFHLTLRRYLAERPSLVATAMFAFNFYWVMYNRIGLLENFSTLCFVLAFYFFVSALEREWLAAWSGCFVALAVLSKYLFAYFLLSALLAAAVHSLRRRRFRFFAIFCGGVLGVAALWFFVIYLPFHASFSKIGKGWGALSLPRSLGQVAANIVGNPVARYMQLMPIEFVLGMLFIVLVAFKAVRREKERPDSVEVFVFFWLIGVFFQMGVLNYRPMRYYLPAIPALFFALSLVFRDRKKLPARSIPFWLSLTLLSLLFFRFFRYLVFSPSAFFLFPPLLRGFVFVSFAVVLLYPFVRNDRFRLSGEIVLVLIVLASSLYLYVDQFYRKPTYHLQTAAEYMKRLPADSLVMGQEAPRLTLETPLKSLLAYEGWFNDRDPFGLYRPTHLVVLDRFHDAEMAWIRRRFGPIAADLVPLKKFRVWDSTMTLYRVRYTSRTGR